MTFSRFYAAGTLLFDRVWDDLRANSFPLTVGRAVYSNALAVRLQDMQRRSSPAGDGVASLWQAEFLGDLDRLSVRGPGGKAIHLGDARDLLRRAFGHLVEDDGGEPST